MARLHSSRSDLSCYITIYLQNVGREQEAVGQESLTTTILANLLFPYKLGPGFNRVGVTGTILDMLYLKCMKHPSQEITGQLNTRRSSILRRDVVVVVV